MKKIRLLICALLFFCFASGSPHQSIEIEKPESTTYSKPDTVPKCKVAIQQQVMCTRIKTVVQHEVKWRESPTLAQYYRNYYHYRKNNPNRFYSHIYLYQT